jgi:hypothetical protein
MALAALILLGSVGLAEGELLAAPLSQEDLYVITFPSDNATVNGVVEITGTVTHPNFDSYGVLYAPGPAPTADSQWATIVFGVEEPVVNDVLATWDTTALTEDGQPVVPDGVYTLALARYRDGRTGPDDPIYFVLNVTVSNGAVTATPPPTNTPEPLPTAVPVTPTPPSVEQPPTSTPRPSPAPGPGGGETTVPQAGEEGGEDDELLLDLGRLRGAFFRGMRIALLLFGLWGLYFFGKAGVRYYLREYGPGPPGRRE